MNREARRAAGFNGHQQQLALVAQMPQQQVVQPQFNVGPLMTLDALVALTAAHCPGSPEEAVNRAVEIVAHATKHAMIGTVGKRIEQLKAEFVKEQEEAARPKLVGTE